MRRRSSVLHTAVTQQDESESEAEAPVACGTRVREGRSGDGDTSERARLTASV
eukprot:COSAG02_NODE_1053_length_14943_cov_3.871076_2_plen_53_part_00